MNGWRMALFGLLVCGGFSCLDFEGARAEFCAEHPGAEGCQSVPPIDGGPPVDAGRDGGPEAEDAGRSDAGGVDASVDGGSAPNPEPISFEPASTDAGSVPVGRELQLPPLGLVNDGGTTVTLNFALTGSTAHFLLATGCSFPLALAPGDRCTFDLRFKPLTSGEKSLRVAVTGADGGVVASYLATGIGVASGELRVQLQDPDAGQVVSTPAGIDCPGTCTNFFNVGSTVVLNVSATPAWQFESWVGCSSTAGTRCDVSTPAGTPKVVDARFRPRLFATLLNSFQGSIRLPDGGAVLNLDGGSCDAGCSSSVIPPEGLLLEARSSDPGETFVRWEGACAAFNENPACILPGDRPAVVVARFAPFNRVFVTSFVLPNAAFGGLDGGDALCMQAADAGGLPGRYVAWLGSTPKNTFSRLDGGRGWVRTGDSLPFADSISEFAAGQVFYPPINDQFGNPVPASSKIFTGSFANGVIPTETCGNWTVSTVERTVVGHPLAGTEAWTAGERFYDCSLPGRLYCFGVDHVAPVRQQRLDAGDFLAFVSTPVAVGSGPGAFDTRCQAQATAFGHPGTFRALVSTTSSPAANRFTSGRSYQRLDGVRVAEGTLSTPFKAALSVLVDGGYVSTEVWAGAFNTTLTAPDALADCQGYTDTTLDGGAILGFSGYADDRAFSVNTVASCGAAWPVYCLED